MPTILTKKSDTPGAVPATANLTNAAGGAELAVNTADRRLFTINSSSAVVELGTNPSSLTCADASFTLMKAASATITNLTATSIVISNLSIASANITTLTSTNATAASLTVSTGNLTFSSTAQRITGDFSNATHANRLSFQTSTTNGSTTPFLLPNGTGPTSALVMANASDPTNCSFLQVQAATISTNIVSGILGTGTYLPMTFATGGSERMRLDTSGLLGIGGTPVAALSINKQSTALSGTGNSYGVYVYPTSTGATYVDAVTSLSGATSLNLRTYNNGTYNQLVMDSSGNVGIGGTTNAAIRLDSVGTMPAQTTAYNIAARGTISNSTTSSFSGAYVSPTTTAAAFTLTNLFYYNADASSFGAGSTVTNQYGFIAQSNLTGATNNYGFYSNIASGSNRWNFYAAGTAANYFEGNVGIGKSPTTKLDVSGTITGTSAAFTSATISNISLGTTQGNTKEFLVLATTSGNADSLRHFAIRTSNGSDWTTDGLRIQRLVDVTWHAYMQFGGGNNEGISFGTGGSTVGPLSITERMRIDNAGNVGIGTTSPANLLHVNGTARATFFYGLAAGTDNVANFGNSQSNIRIGGNGSHVTLDSSPWGLNVVAGTAAATVIYVNTSGNVGIGTASPGVKLDVVGGRTNLAANSEVYALGVKYNSTTGPYYIGATNSGTPDLVFSQVGGTERMRITNAGYVGIGRTPSVTLDVDGPIYSRYTATWGAAALYMPGGYSQFGKDNGHRTDIVNTGGLDANSPFWIGYQWCPPDVITNSSGQNSFPRTSFYFNYSTVTNPSNMTWNMYTGNNNGIPISWSIGTESAGTFNIVTSGNARFTVGASGQFGIAGANYGTSGQVFTSNGASSAPSWQTISGIPTNNVTSSTSISAVAGNHYILRSGTAATVTLPSSPSAGSIVWVTVANGLTTNVIARNGVNIQGLAEDMTLNSAYAAVQLRYSDATMGWVFC